jgi:PEP-CTERM motif
LENQLRRIFAVLILSLCFALPTIAHADSFEYTLVDNYTGFSSIAALVGTYTFTLPSKLTGTTFVYGPGFTASPYPGYTYVYASDFTVPAGSAVDQIQIFYDPQSNDYGFGLYGDAVLSTTLLQDPQNPNLFTADYGPQGSLSMEITDLGPSQVPEPSTFIMLGTGVLGLATQVRRRTTRP